MGPFGVVAGSLVCPYEIVAPGRGCVHTEASGGQCC